MGARGPAPTPTAVLQQRGSRRAKSRPNEPKPEHGAPRMPRGLSKTAAAVWKQLVPQLKAMGVLTRIDGNALERYCCLWVRWRRGNQFLEKNGETYPLYDDKGKLRCFVQFPQVAIVNKLSVLLLRLEQEFGLTPASRTRIEVKVPEEPDANSKARFFRPKLVG